MLRPVDYWNLPGPRRFIEELRSGIHAGRLLVVEDPMDAGSTAQAIAQGLRDANVFVCIGPEEWTGTLATTISSATGFPEKALPVFVADNRLRGSILVVWTRVLNEALLPDLKAFSVTRNMLSHQDSPPLSMVIVAGRVNAEGTLPVWGNYTTQGIIDPLDALVFASSEVNDDAWLVKRLKTLVAVEVGAWDVELVARLTRMSLENAVRPDLCPGLWTGGYDFEATTPSWYGRSSAIWGGEEIVHAAWLARHRPHALKRRVWAGQLAALLPWIDQFRLQVIETYSALLSSMVSGEKYRQSIQELDWGPIYYRLKDNRSVAASTVKMCEAMRTVRNELAHSRPAEWASIKTAFDLSSSFRIDLRNKSAR